MTKLLLILCQIERARGFIKGETFRKQLFELLAACMLFDGVKFFISFDAVMVVDVVPKPSRPQCSKGSF